ncbi:unnamed protein product [Mortierella alpina]
MTGDSTNSAVYPTYATYRQAQHGNFDAFAQRIRKALESANAENRLQQQRQEQEQQEESESQQEQAQSKLDDIDSCHDDPSEKKLLSALSATHSRQLMDATETGSIASATGSLGSLSATKTTAGAGERGRPRSSSAASMISNLSEKLRIGGTTLFSRTGRPRAGSDASVIIPTTTGPTPGVAIASTTSGTSTTIPAIPSSDQSKSTSATTTMAAMAAAAAVASAMTIPRSSAYNPDMDAMAYSIPHGQTQSQARRARRHSAIMHPLAKTSHVDDDDDDNSEHDESLESLEGGDVSRTAILADDQKRPCT